MSIIVVFDRSAPVVAVEEGEVLLVVEGYEVLLVLELEDGGVGEEAGWHYLTTTTEDFVGLRIEDVDVDVLAITHEGDDSSTIVATDFEACITKEEEGVEELLAIADVHVEVYVFVVRDEVVFANCSEKGAVGEEEGDALTVEYLLEEGEVAGCHFFVYGQCSGEKWHEGVCVVTLRGLYITIHYLFEQMFLHPTFKAKWKKLYYTIMEIVIVMIKMFVKFAVWQYVLRMDKRECKVVHRLTIAFGEVGGGVGGVGTKAYVADEADMGEDAELVLG